MIHPFSQPPKIKTHLREEQLSEIQSVFVVVVASSEQKPEVARGKYNHFF